uniref:portal protein n=1 Tax=Arsukibacterium sp. TaxID=1977258 RepID=UPI002FD97C0A
GDQLQNRPAIHVHPVEENKVQAVQNLAGNSDYDMAELYQYLIRNIEYTSNAETHYDRAFQHCVEGGFGWLRVLTCYANDHAFDQDIKITSIANRFSVLMDPDGTEPDCSDRNYCFISERMKKKDFDRKYPGKRTGELGDADRGEYSWWVNEEHIRVAEYFYRVPAKRKLLLLSDQRTVFLDEIEKALPALVEQGITVLREREVQTFKVMWEKITAYDVLEGPKEWPGSTLPITPVLGKEIILSDKTYYRGLIRYAKDAQRMHNFWMTAATERVALAPKAPWTAPAEAIEGYEAEWAAANRENRSVLRYNSLPNGDKPSREQPPSMPSAELQIAMSMTDEMKATIGIYDASMGAQSNETSGRAILARQRQGDRGTFAYIDNLGKAIRRIGQILIEIIPKVYDTERVVRMRFEDETGDYVRINQVVQDPVTMEEIKINDISLGRFDVTIKTGPSYQTQRMEAADSLMQFVQAMPAAGGVIMDLIAKNMDWPGASDIAERLRKILPPGILTPQEQEEAGMDTEPPAPTPAEQAEMVKAEADIAEAQARMAEAQQKLAEVEALAVMQGAGSPAEFVKGLVAEAMAELIQSGAMR